MLLEFGDVEEARERAAPVLVVHSKTMDTHGQSSSVRPQQLSPQLQRPQQVAVQAPMRLLESAPAQLQPFSVRVYADISDDQLTALFSELTCDERTFNFAHAAEQVLRLAHHGQERQNVHFAYRNGERFLMKLGRNGVWSEHSVPESSSVLFADELVVAIHKRLQLWLQRHWERDIGCFGQLRADLDSIVLAEEWMTVALNEFGRRDVQDGKEANTNVSGHDSRRATMDAPQRVRKGTALSRKQSERQFADDANRLHDDDGKKEGQRTRLSMTPTRTKLKGAAPRKRSPSLEDVAVSAADKSDSGKASSSKKKSKQTKTPEKSAIPPSSAASGTKRNSLGNRSTKRASAGGDVAMDDLDEIQHDLAKEIRNGLPLVREIAQQGEDLDWLSKPTNIDLKLLYFFIERRTQATVGYGIGARKDGFVLYRMRSNHTFETLGEVDNYDLQNVLLQKKVQGKLHCYTGACALEYADHRRQSRRLL